MDDSSARGEVCRVHQEFLGVADKPDSPVAESQSGPVDISQEPNLNW